MDFIKKVIAILVVVILGFFLIYTVGGVIVSKLKPTTYRASSGFYYSRDKGHSYGDGTKEYDVGDTVYMKVKFKVVSSSDRVTQVTVTLTIPNVESVDARYMDGQIITPNYDSVNNVTTYEFTANASSDAEEEECIIQFVPNAPGEVTMTLEYDDHLDSSYDEQSTLIFVE